MKKLKLFVYFSLIFLWVGEQYPKPPLNSALLEQWFREVLIDFPEFRNRSVHLVYTKRIDSAMETQPSLFTVFSKSKDRTYCVYLSVRNGHKDFLLSLTEPEWKGWFAHELGHALDYDQNYKGRFDMPWFGLTYLLDDDFHREAEKRADLNAISHGYGCELIDGVEKSLSSDKLPEERKKALKYFYSSPLILIKYQMEYESK